MNPGHQTHDPAQAPSSAEMERPQAAVTSPGQGNVAVEAAAPRNSAVQPYDFRNPMPLAPAQMRKLRSHQQEFAAALATRLSLCLRLECSLKLTGLQIVAFGGLARDGSAPSHFSLFKIEPLRGVSFLEIPPALGLSMVDRLMGGPGQAPDVARELSEIENALLDQVVQLILGEWCGHWSGLKELKPVPLGVETNGRFVQSALPETMMLVLVMEARIGNCVGQLRLASPYTSLEPFIRQVSTGADTTAEAPAQPATKPPCKWNPSCDDVRIPLVAEWQGIELTAREILALRVGDVLQINGPCAQQVKVRLADHPKFNGHLGTLAGNWAVELTHLINR